MEKQVYKESFFQNSEKVKLYRRIYEPNSTPMTALVFLCHGLFEHNQSAYYEPIIKPMTDIGCLVLTHDHYGHGRSEGNRGVIENLDILVRDVISDIEEIVKELEIPEKLPIFLYGHSMGGLIAVLATLKKKDFFKGMVLEGPALAHNVNAITVLLGRIIKNVYPCCPMKYLDNDAISRDKEYISTILNDPLQIQMKVPAITAVSIIDAICNCKDYYKEVNTPVFIGHGECDTLTLACGSKIFMESISSQDKTLIIYPGAKHQLRMEIDNVNIDFAEKVISWLKERIK